MWLNRPGPTFLVFKLAKDEWSCIKNNNIRKSRVSIPTRKIGYEYESRDVLYTYHRKK